ncbi:hypothetical protein jhhlp_005023 [Lomentospora prolificans]|uniref:CFEM domain-containing protein n=1 Tax=Lomentospora prolificans TaxID=41688 RepID=A0A2N3N856_9PEZI|nr:hypothetical protein jhhlp_005023 [Lomentospora prolificans]
MRALSPLITSLLLLTPGTYCQRIFINQVPEYSQLPVCAEVPLSQIVRNMVSGCGDGGRTTSYDCFCVASSTRFAKVISTAVASKCPADDGVSAALEVFDSFCQLRPGTTPITAVVNSSTLTSEAVQVTPDSGDIEASSKSSSESVSTYTPVRTQTGPISSSDLGSGTARVGWIGPGALVALQLALYTA